MRPRPRPLGVLAAVCCLLCLVASPAAAKDKDKRKPSGPPKTGTFPMDLPPTYVQMSVPADYDAKKWYPLLFVLAPDATKPDAYVGAWAESPLAKTWILASRHCPIYDNEETIKPLIEALDAVKAAYHVDDRRVVIAGHNAGAMMAWRMMVREPTLWAGIITMSGEIPDGDRTQSALKGVVGKPVYIFRGDKDGYYTQNMLDRDKKYLDSMKIPATVEIQKDWATDFPRGSLPAIAAWLEGVWPPGAYREKADAAEKAIAAKDIQAGNAAVASLKTELKRNPYPAYEPRAEALYKALLDLGRTKIDEAKRLLEAGQGLLALEAYEAAVTALRGVKPLDSEAAAALAAAKKSPVVVEALRKKEAESAASVTMERAAAAEAKGDLARALELYKKVAALGETTKKAEAEQKIQEIEPKVAGK